MIASLPMYDMPETRGATDALWRGIVRHLAQEGLKHFPPNLVHDVPLHDLWSDDKLFFSQCCGYDVLHRYRDRLRVLVTPCFTAPGCIENDYASIIVVPEDSRFEDVLDMYGTIAVINGPESHSGTNALFGLVGPFIRGRKYFSEVKISGTHADSLSMLKRGQADVASIDCVTYALLKRYRRTAIGGTRPLGQTYPAPAPPYVVQKTVDMEIVERIETALRNAFNDPATRIARETLMLDGVQIGTGELYQRISAEFKHDLRAV